MAKAHSQFTTWFRRHLVKFRKHKFEFCQAFNSTMLQKYNICLHTKLIFLSNTKTTASYTEMKACSLVILANMKLTVSIAWGEGKSTNHQGNIHFLEAEQRLILSLEMQIKAKKRGGDVIPLNKLRSFNNSGPNSPSRILSNPKSKERIVSFLYNICYCQNIENGSLFICSLDAFMQWTQGLLVNHDK